MIERDYNQELYEKMVAEQQAYREHLLHSSPEEILNHTWEYTMREDMVMAMEDLNLPPARAKALLKEKYPLGQVLEKFRDWETDHMDNICDAIEACGKDALKRERRNRECR